MAENAEALVNVLTGGELRQQRTVPTLSNLTPEFCRHMLDAVTSREVLEGMPWCAWRRSSSRSPRRWTGTSD